MKISFIKLIIGCVVLVGSFLLVAHVKAECCSGYLLNNDPSSIAVVSCNDGSGVNYSVANIYTWSCGAPLCTSYNAGQLWCPVGAYYMPIRWDIVGVGAGCSGGCMDCIRQSPTTYGHCGGGCTPDCSCAASTCSGSTCSDNCGGTCAGTASNALLNVSKNGSGTGTITSNPAGIDCGATCSHSYTCNSSVTLSAVPLGGSTFSGWSGEGCSGTGSCVVSMTQNRSAIATFGTPPPPAPTNLHYTGKTVDTISWAWNASPGATSYNVYLGRYYYDTMHYFSFTSNLSFIQNQYYGDYNPYGGDYYLVYPIFANYMHNFAVSACNAGGCSGLSIGSVATSIEEPDTIVGTAIGMTSMTVTAYNDPYYQRNLSNLTEGVSGVSFTETVTNQTRAYSQSPTWNITGLSPLTTYSFYVKAKNQQGDETAEYRQDFSTIGPSISGSLRTYGPGSSVLKLALIAVSDALLMNKGTVKNRIASGADLAAFLVEPTDPNASPVRVMTPFGIKAWRKAP